MKIRLLLLEDNETDAFLLIRHLENNGVKLEYERIYTEEAMKEAINTKEWDLIISDYSMPGFDGEEALKIFKESKLEIPFIVISGTIGEDVAVETMRNGAHDYLMKDSLTRLVPAIKRELKDAENRRKKKEQEISREIIYNISNKTISSATDKELYYTIESELRKIIDTTNLFVGLYKKDSDKIIFPYMKDYKDDFKELPIGKTLSEIVIKENKPLLLNEKEILELESKNIIDKIGSRSKSWLGIPLIVDKNAIGIIVIQDYKKNNAFSKDDVRLLSFVSEHIAISIQKKNSEEQIKKLSQSVEQSPASVVITDINGNIEYVNSKFSEITEYKLSEVIGENSRILKSGLHSDEFYKVLWETISSGKEWRGEFHNKSKNGKLIWESASISPIKNYSGKITHFVAVKEDITEKKRNYEELVAAKEQAEKSDKLKSTFLATMSHELRTPLNSIIGFAELISSEFLEHKDDVDNAKLIYQSGHDLLTLINNLFDSSLIEVGEMKVNKSEVSINKTLDGIEVEYSGSDKIKYGKVKLEFIKEFKYDKDIVVTDKIKLKQVLSNLIGNSIKFTNKGLIKISYKLITDKKNNEFIEFSIKDTGIGIPKEKQELIFDKFRQVEDSHTRAYGGAGLGLSLSKKIVELLGGEMYLESELGKGSTFYFTLPNNDVIEKKKKTIPGSKIRKRYNWSGKKILIVEDVTSNYKLIEFILQQTNAAIIGAINGIQAIEVCKSNKDIDLVVMDLRLPEISGFEATKEIKKLHPNLPVIAQTSYALEGDKERSLNAGCDDYIVKPLDKELFLSKINKLLS